MTAFILLSSPAIHAEDFDFSVFAGFNRGGDLDNVFIGGRDVFTEPPPTLDPAGSYSGGGARFGAALVYRGWAGFEVGWSDLGSENRLNSHFVEFGCPGGCGPGEGIIIDTVEQRADAMWAAFVPTLRRSSWDLFGKIGASRLNNESRQRTNRSNRLRVTNTGLMFGVGVAFYTSTGLGLRIDLEHLDGSVTQGGMALAFRF